MGQMTYAVMYGCKQEPPPPKPGEEDSYEGWYDVINAYKPGPGLRPDTPCGDGDHDMIGFWVAVGASGEDDCPDLDTDFPLDGFANMKAYAKAHRRAVKAWERFSAWCAKKRIKVGAARLWLVQTEVA